MYAYQCGLPLYRAPAQSSALNQTMSGEDVIAGNLSSQKAPGVVLVVEFHKGVE